MAWGNSNPQSIESYLVEIPGGRPPPRRIQALTGITEDTMQAALPLPEVMDKFFVFLKENLSKIVLNENFDNSGPGEDSEQAAIENNSCFPRAVIHFAQFEKPFLRDAAEYTSRDLNFPILCTYEIAKRLFPNLPTCGIKGLAGYYGYPVEDSKRSRYHVELTQVIWEGLIESLKEKGIHTLEDLEKWMIGTPKKSRTKYEYPLPKEKRLRLPKEPGVYRMKNKVGETLYVGKGTSLRARVNSYFRGQKSRDPKELEMLTQVWDLEVTVCGSPLAAALLETDEIKRLNPRYNVSLKTGTREMAFYSKDFQLVSRTQDESHPLGPFSNAYVFDFILKLSKSLRKRSMNQYLFFDPIGPELLQQGFDLFCKRHRLVPTEFQNPRTAIALGLIWYRQLRHLDQQADLPETESDDRDEVIFEDTAPEGTTESGSEGKLLELTPEEVADKFRRHFVRAGKAYWRSRQLSRLLNSKIRFRMPNSEELQTLLIKGGIIASWPKETKPVRPSLPWAELDIPIYDRMTVLYSELDKIKSRKGFVQIRTLC